VDFFFLELYGVFTLHKHLERADVEHAIMQLQVKLRPPALDKIAVIVNGIASQNCRLVAKLCLQQLDQLAFHLVQRLALVEFVHKIVAVFGKILPPDIFGHPFHYQFSAMLHTRLVAGQRLELEIGNFNGDLQNHVFVGIQPGHLQIHPKQLGWEGVLVNHAVIISAHPGVRKSYALWIDPSDKNSIVDVMEQIAATPQNYELAATVYEARYAALAERVQDPQQAFVTFLHTAMVEVPIFQLQGGLGISGHFFRPSYARTHQEIEVLNQNRPENLESSPDPGHGTAAILHTIRQADKLLRNKEEDVTAKLQSLCILGLLAGGCKPDGAVDTDGINKTVRDQGDNLMVFTAAVTKIKRLLLPRVDQEKSKFSENDLRNPKKAPAAVRTLNRHSLHVYASKILERLGSPGTRLADIYEEASYLGGLLHEPNPDRWRFGAEVPETVTVDWPILPPDETKKPDIPAPDPSAKPTSEGRKAELAAIRDQRKAMVAFMVALWGSEAFTIEVEMRGKGSSKYQAAVLPEQTPQGIKVHSFAENPDIDNALFALRAENIRGFEIDTTNKATITESLRAIFSTTKTAAGEYGAHRIPHSTQRMAEILLEYLTRPPDQLRET
jgi:hypothetical protein